MRARVHDFCQYMVPNKALHLTAISLRSIAAGKLGARGLTKGENII